MRLCRPQWTTCKFHNFPEIRRDSWDISSKGLYLWAFLLASIGRTSWDHWKLFLWSGFLGSKWWPLWFCVVLSKLVLGLGWGRGPIPNMKYIKIETVDMFNVDWPQTPPKVFVCYKRPWGKFWCFLRDDFPTKRGHLGGPTRFLSIYSSLLSPSSLCLGFRNRDGWGFPIF